MTSHVRHPQGKTVFSIAVMATALAGLCAGAAPVQGGVFNLCQPDGSTVAVRIWGDEFFQVVESLDGYTLVRDPSTMEITYATLSANGNELLTTGISASGPSGAKTGLARHIRIARSSAQSKIQARRARFEQAAAEHLASLGFSPGAKMAAPSGEVQGICLLVDFRNDPATIPRGNVESFCNEAGYTGYSNNGSIRDYFYEVSGGLLTYTNYVTTAYYRAKNLKSYYDNPREEAGPKAQELIQEALNWLNGQGFDFSEYDADGDGLIDAINCFYAGECRSGWSMGLWPHQWFVEFSADGVSSHAYQIVNMSSDLSIGTFAHENGHMLCEFPDLYDYDNGGLESQGVGIYCLMACGSLASDERNPTQPCAYLKSLAGWATINTLATPQSGLVLEAGVNTFYRYSRPGYTNQYFLIENRNNTGRDSSLPDGGLAIWHIDSSVGHNNYEEMTPSQHYMVSLEQADGRYDLEHNANSGDSEDLFDGNSHGVFNDTTTPASLWWDRSESSLQIHSVSAAGDTMTFGFGEETGDPNAFKVFNDGGSLLQVSSIEVEPAAPFISFDPAPPFTVDAGNYQAVSVAVQWAEAPIGPSTFSLGIHSDAGADPTVVTLNLVNSPPAHAVSTPSTPAGPLSGESGEELQFSTGGSTCSQGHGVQYAFDWGDGQTSGWSGTTKSHTYAADGSYPVRAKARCSLDAGVESELSSALSVFIGVDSEAPSVQITSPGSGGIYASTAATLDLAGTASDNAGVTEVNWTNDRGGSGTAVGTGSWSVTGIELWSGQNVLTVTARDMAGNEGEDTLIVTYTPLPGWQWESVNWRVNYDTNWHRSGVVTKPGASRIRVHFRSINVEEDYDYLVSSSGDVWSGEYLNVLSGESAGDSMTFTLTSDEYVYGSFVIDRIDYQGDSTGPAAVSGELFSELGQDECLVLDGGFEAALAASPWYEDSTTAASRIQNNASLARTGNGAVWFGNMAADDEAYVGQEFCIPRAASATLHFWVACTGTTGATGEFALWLDDEVALYVPLGYNDFSGGYVEMEADISAYADGWWHSLWIAGVGTSNILIDDVCITTSEDDLPAPWAVSPNLEAEEGNDVAFSWTEVPGATQYLLEVATGPSMQGATGYGPFTATGAELSGFCGRDAVYWWRVKAGNSSGWGSWSSANLFYTVCDCPPPAAPAGVAASQDRTDGVFLDWNAVEGAVEYHVYRDTRQSVYATVDAPVTFFLDLAALPPDVPAPGCSSSEEVEYHDHTYWIMAVNECGESASSIGAQGHRTASKVLPAGEARTAGGGDLAGICILLAGLALGRRAGRGNR